MSLKTISKSIFLFSIMLATLIFGKKDRDPAKDVFSPPGSEGIATVVIDNYVIYYAPTEIWNTADLIEVVEKH